MPPPESELRRHVAKLEALFAQAPRDPGALRAALTQIPASQRDACVDQVFALGLPADDGADLPQGCVPYLPCSVGTVLLALEHAAVHSSDVFVDVGSGAGRAAAVAQLLTGAKTIGIEIQPALVSAADELAARLQLSALTFVQGDAAHRSDALNAGTVFFLYCPFGGERLASVLTILERLARTREIRVCCVDLPLPECGWLEVVSTPSLDLTVYRSSAMRA